MYLMFLTRLNKIHFLDHFFQFYPSIDTRQAVAQSSHFVASPRSPPHTDGALDLGGASTQIAFVPSNNSTAQDLDEFNLYYRDYRVYSYSHLCFGLNEAMRQYRARLVVVNYNYNLQLKLQFTRLLSCSSSFHF